MILDNLFKDQKLYLSMLKDIALSKSAIDIRSGLFSFILKCSQDCIPVSILPLFLHQKEIDTLQEKFEECYSVFPDPSRK
jgi:DNA-binding protein YbaB